MVSPACFAHLTSHLMTLARGKVAVVLEGGYCLRSLAEGAALTLRTLLGGPVPALHNITGPLDEVIDSILSAIYVHRPYWQCYPIQETFHISETPSESKISEKRISIFPESSKFIPRIKFKGDILKPRPVSFKTRNCYPVLSVEEQVKVEGLLDHLKEITDLTIPPDRVAIAYDEDMVKHRSPPVVDHPEKPERILTIYAKLKEYGIFPRCVMLPVGTVSFSI